MSKDHQNLEQNEREGSVPADAGESQNTAAPGAGVSGGEPVSDGESVSEGESVSDGEAVSEGQEVSGSGDEADGMDVSDGIEMEDGFEADEEDAAAAEDEESPVFRDQKSKRREAPDKAFEAQSGKGRSRRRKKGHKGLFLSLGVLVFLIGGAFIAYGVKAQDYRDRFFPKTVINGVMAQGMTAEEVKEQIASGIDGYTLTIRERDGSFEVLSKEDIGLHSVFDGTLEQILEEQDPYHWGKAYFKPVEYTISAMVAHEDEKLDAAMDRLNCFQESQVVKPADARLSEYVSGQGYSVIPEVEGNELNRDMVREAIITAVTSLQPEISLDELGCYLEPGIRGDDPGLITLRDNLNRYANTTVTYQFGSRQEVLEGSTIVQWLTVNEDNTVSLNGARVSEFVSGLASKYNTAYTTRSFRTSYDGRTVKVSGPYGWRIDQGAEVEALTKLLKDGTSETREPIYSQKAAQHDGSDYGDTYAEVNLTAQRLFFYKDGKKVLESDFVSGNVQKDYTTPPGLFGLTYKERDAVLKGEDYRTPVDFWMPFNGGIGFHDATWRSSFGGSIYKTNGSHGCVNMPYEKAKELYSYVYTNVPVICYNLEGTERSSSSAAEEKPAETTAAPSEPASSAAETTAAPTTAAPSEPASSAAETTAAAPEETAAPAEIVPVQPETTAAAETTKAPDPGPAAGPSVSETTAGSEAGSGGEAGPDAGSAQEFGPGTVPTTAAPVITPGM